MLSSQKETKRNSFIFDETLSSNFEWEEIHTTAINSYPSNRNCHTAVLYQKYMITFGGKEGEGKKKFLNDVHILDMEKYCWYNLAKITGIPPEPRMGHTAGLCSLVLDQENVSYVIIFGGWNGYQILNDVYYLKIYENEPLSLEWVPSNIQGESPKRQFHTANVFEDKMYVFGGGDGKFWLNDLYMLNVSSQKWQQIETQGKAPSGRLQHSSALVNKKIYIFGGEPDRLRQLNDLFMYDIITNVWHSLEPVGSPLSPRVSVSSVVVGNKIYFFGGYDGQFWKNDIYTYNTDDNIWEQAITNNSPPNQRCRHTSIFYKDKIVIFGGNDSEKSYNDLHILKMEISLKIEESNLIQNLKQMFQQKQFCDVIFVVDEVEIPAHKSILSARSEHFYSLFNSQLMESQSKKIHVHDSQPKTFEALLEYLYTDSVSLNDEVAGELLILANRYIINRLKNTCEEFLARKLSVKNIVEMTNLAEKHNATFLKEYALRFMITNKQTICETQDISKLSKEVLVELFKLREKY